MDKQIFFALLKIKGVIPSPDNFSEPEYELFLVNDSDHPIRLKRQDFGGFKTFEDFMVMATPQDIERDIVIEPHGYVPYAELYADSFDGAGQYTAYVEVGGIIKRLMFYTSRGVGFLGTQIPCMENKYGRIIHPIVTDLEREE